jgi:hypothetical protein
MKYICTNPEVLVKEIKENGIYGRDMIMSRINLGKSEPEHGLGARIVNPCLDFAKGLIPEANITEAFSYTYNSSRHNVGHIYVWENLEEIFEIENIEKDKNGETLIHVRYMPAKLERTRSEEEKEQAKEKWDKLEEIYQSQGLNSYTDEEVNVIVNSVIDKYTEDLAKREDVVIEQSPLAGSIYLGGGTNYFLENLEYNFNGEKIIVEALTKGDPDAHIEVSESRFPDEKGLMDVTIYRKAKNGKKERLAIVMVDAAEYPEYGKEISCRILNRNYDLHDVLNSFHPWYYYIDPNTDDIKRGEEKRVSEEEFKEFIKDMVLPEKIEKLKEVFWKKMKFVVIDEANPSPKKDIQWGIIERGDWPEELKNQTLEIDLSLAKNQGVTQSK